MEELMQAIRERTGLPGDKAQEAAEAAMDFFRDKLPGGLGERLEEVVAGNTDAIADAAGSLTDRAKGMFS